MKAIKLKQILRNMGPDEEIVIEVTVQHPYEDEGSHTYLIEDIDDFTTRGGTITLEARVVD